MTSTNKSIPVDDADIQKAIEIVTREQRASISLLQRRMHIGYGYSFFIMQKLEELGIVSADPMERIVLKK
jgi:DNA segregation ATPase FtsK/SpoIIIE-like protein